MTHRRQRRLIEQARSINEGPISTGIVLTTPSSVSRSDALGAVEGFRLDGAMRDLGGIVGRAIADEIEAEQLRPADYAAWPEISARARERIVKRLAAGCRNFDEALAQALGSRG